MAVKPGKRKQIATSKGTVMPRNKVFLTVGKGIVLKGKVKRGSP